MIGIVCGLREIEFDTEKGEHLHFYKVHVQYLDGETEGYAVRSFNISMKRIARVADGWLPCIGDRLLLSFGERGRVEDCYLLDGEGRPVVREMMSNG